MVIAQRAALTAFFFAAIVASDHFEDEGSFLQLVTDARHTMQERTSVDDVDSPIQYDTPVKSLHAELSLLAADASYVNRLTDDALRGIDWHRSVEVQDLNTKGEDYLITYKKGCTNTGSPLGMYCNLCAISLSATDDDHDLEQDDNLTDATYCGHPEFHGGVVDELRGFYSDESWKWAMADLSPQRCKRVIAVGHSLGGALAGLFAFCANNHAYPREDKDRYNAIRSDVELVTFGAMGLSRSPVYNGKYRTCFNGARYGVDHKDLAPTKREFSHEALKAYGGMLGELGGTDDKDRRKQAVRVFDTVKYLQAMNKAGNDTKWATGFQFFMKNNGRKMSRIIGKASDQAAKERERGLLNTPLQKAMMDFDTLGERYADQLTFNYDAVPGTFSAIGYYHPFVRYIGLKHPMGTGGNVPNPEPVGECKLSDANLPVFNPIRSLFGTAREVVSNRFLPNHQICCYWRGIVNSIREKNFDGVKCASKFDIVMRKSSKPSPPNKEFQVECPEPKWR